MNYSVVRPISPIKPICSEKLFALIDTQLLLNLLCAVASAVFLQYVTIKILSHAPACGKDSKNVPKYHATVAAIVAVMLYFFGWSLLLIKGVIFLLVLLYATVSDIRTREVSDCVSVMLFVAAFIGATPKNYLLMFIGGLFVGAVMLLGAIITKNRIGGADVKLSAACAFFLGLWNGVFGLMMGLLLAVVTNAVLKRKCKQQSFPLVPYLAAGCMAAYFI